MKLTKKINAFTLTELLVAMVVSSLVISLAFLSLSIIQRQLKSIQNNIQAKQNTEFLERRLWKDLNEYDAKYDDVNDVLFLKNAKDSLIYSFEEKFITRANDTIALGVKSKTFYLDGKTISSGNLDAVKLETSLIFGNSKLFFHKTKDASFYLNK